MTVLLNSVDGAARGFAESVFLCRSLLQKHNESPLQLPGLVLFPVVYTYMLLDVGVCHFCQKTFTAQALRYLPPGRGDQILRRCMHTFECQLDSADRFGDVCRQSSVWLLKQTQSRVTNWATYCHPFHHNVGIR